MPRTFYPISRSQRGLRDWQKYLKNHGSYQRRGQSYPKAMREFPLSLPPECSKGLRRVQFSMDYHFLSRRSYLLPYFFRGFRLSGCKSLSSRKMSLRIFWQMMTSSFGVSPHTPMAPIRRPSIVSIAKNIQVSVNSSEDISQE